MNPDPLTVTDEEYEAMVARLHEMKRRHAYVDPEPELPRRRDARLVVIAFAGMALIAAVAWMLQQ